LRVFADLIVKVFSTGTIGGHCGDWQLFRYTQ